MSSGAERYLIEGADFREFLEPELVRLLSEIWNRKKDPLRPCWIVIPAAPLARHLKQGLLLAQVPLLNVEFLTITGLRDRLVMEHDIPTALSREKQELLLRVMLEEAGRNRETSSVLLTAIDAMRDAGHPASSAFEEEGDAFRKLAEAFEKRVGENSVQHLDRELLKRAESAPRRERDVVLYGFDAGDWAGAWILLAGVLTAARSAVFHRNAGGQVESLEMSWMSWWREHYGEHHLPGSPGSNFSARVPALKELEERMFVPMREARAGVNAEEPLKNAGDAVMFLRHRSASLEARDASALAGFWAAELGGRVGLIFAGANSLSRLAASHLQEWEVLFEDQLGSPLNDPPENAVFKIWLQIQEEGPHTRLIEALSRGLRELPINTPLRRELADPLDEVLKALEEGMTRSMSDDLRVIARSLDGKRDRGAVAISYFVAQWDHLGWPENATPSEMSKRMAETLNFLFGDRAYELESGFAGCLSGLQELLADRPLARSEWVRYLSAALDGTDRVRHGSNYSPVVVTSLERSRGQCFDAVIFCGLNEGNFPELLPELPFHLDKRAQDLDRAVSKWSEDDHVRKFGRWQGPVLNFTAERGLERQHFWDIIANARARVCFSSFIWDDMDSHAEKEPSELYDWAWWAAHGFQNSAAREEETKRVEHATREWAEWVARHMPRCAAPAGLEQMAEAARARFDPGTPFEDCQFVFSSKDAWMRQFGKKSLQVTLAEDTLGDPAGVWFERVLEVSPRVTGGTAIDALLARRGSLVHDAVLEAMRKSGCPVSGTVPELHRPDRQAVETRRKALDAWVGNLRAAVDSWFGRLPVWWEIELSELRSSAQRVVDFFSEEETPDTLYAVELALSLPLGSTRWSAKLDHISHTGKNWIITDVKTGSGATPKELKPAGLLRNGEGFQLVIYAMILAEQLKLDGSRVMLRYHHPRLRGGGETTQEVLEALAPCALPLVAYLEQAWGGGRFGQRSDKNMDRPLAHLPVPDEILRDKWNRTEGLKEWAWEISAKNEELNEEDERED